MKIIELTDLQFKNYSKLHSSRNYFQTIEFANMNSDYQKMFLGFVDESNNTLMAASLILEKSIGKFKIGYVPGGFLIDYENDDLFKDFTLALKNYLKERNFVYLNTQNRSTYKMFNKNGQVLYFDSNIVKVLDELGYVKASKNVWREVVLETEKTPNETYKLFNANTRRNIKISANRAITIYKDETNNIDMLLSLGIEKNDDKIKKIVQNFNTKNNTAEIYFAKINFEQYINNYRFLLKEEEIKNDKLNEIMQNINIKKSISLINKKMNSDKLITKYNNEIIRATNMYSKLPNETIIGAILIIKNNREICFLDEGYNKELSRFYSSHLIKWEIIKKYLTEGYKIFNFGKINNMDKNNGNYLFKMGFGGKVYEYLGNYDLVINKWLYKIIKIINSLKK